MNQGVRAPTSNHPLHDDPAMKYGTGQYPEGFRLPVICHGEYLRAVFRETPF